MKKKIFKKKILGLEKLLDGCILITKTNICVIKFVFLDEGSGVVLSSYLKKYIDVLKVNMLKK